MARTSTGRRTVGATLAAGALIVGTPALAGAGPAAEEVASDLTGPRGVVAGPGGRVVFAEADGTVSELRTKGKDAGTVAKIAQVPSTGVAPAVDMTGRGQTHILTGQGEAGSGAMTLYRWRPGKGISEVADIGAYQVSDPDADDLEGNPTESNPFGVAVLPDGSVLVSDAAGNDLLRVFPDGDIVTVARLKPRSTVIPEWFDGDGTATTLTEAVATSVTVGADGYYYVGELRGFPPVPGTSQVWRIAPDSVGAVCDPANPDVGACQRYADGFTSIVDLGADRDGNIYVVELAKDTWLVTEDPAADHTGSLIRLATDGSRTELAAGLLMLPGAVDVSNQGEVFVSTWTVGHFFGIPGAVLNVE